MMADQRAREDSFRPPVQDLNNGADPAAELVKVLKQYPDALAQVLENFRHLRVINGAGAPAPPRRNNWLQIITSALQSLASGGFTWARFVFIYLLTTLSDAMKMEGKIPQEHREEFDVMKRNFEGAEMKLKKVEQDVGNLKGAIQRAVEDGCKISNTENKKLEMGFVTTTCDVDSCEDDFARVREANTRLQLGAKESTMSARNLLIVGIILIMAAVISAGLLYHWDGDDDDDDVKLVTKRMKTYMASLAGLLVAAVVFCKQKAQSFLNNRKLFSECEEFKHDDLQKAGLLAKDIKRDVEVRLPLLKKQLDVLDNNGSRYASFSDLSGNDVL